MSTTKKATYRQSGYKENATGEIQEFYGTDGPADPSLFTKLWDNQVVEITIVTPIPDPAVPAPPASGAV